MDSTKLLIGVVVVGLLPQSTLAQQNVKKFIWGWETWAHMLSFTHLVNLTEFLVIDITYKLRHAEKIQDLHKHSITYELGTIAAGVLDHFKNMLRMYRKYSEEQSFYRRDYPVWEYMYAFHNILGEYNEIRLEQGMFYDIVRAYEATQGQTTQFTLPKWFTLPSRGIRRFFRDMINNTARHRDFKSTRTTLSYSKLWGSSKKSLWKSGAGFVFN